MMNSKVVWLRISYWSAAIADFVITISVLIPENMGLSEFALPMGLMSAVAFSWGLLLLMADGKPVERRWILIPTIIVVSLLTGVRIYVAIVGIVEFSIVYTIIGIMLIFLMSYSYINSKDVKEFETHEALEWILTAFIKKTAMENKFDLVKFLKTNFEYKKGKWIM